MSADVLALGDQVKPGLVSENLHFAEKKFRKSLAPLLQAALIRTE